MFKNKEEKFTVELSQLGTPRKKFFLQASREQNFDDVVVADFVH
jgi:hypothetical protein